MKKIITALGIPEINNKLNKILNDNFIIIFNDILYREGILEILEKNKNINIIIINEKLPGEIEINFLLNKIREINKKIKIILFINKIKIKKIKNKENIIFIFEEKNDNYSYIVQKINSKLQEIYQVKYKEEINKKLKKESKIVQNENFHKTNFREQMLVKIDKEISEIDCKNLDYSPTPVIIMGTPGIGKSIISTLLCTELSFRKRKVLLVDLDEFTGSIHTVLQKKVLKNEIQNINNYFDFIVTDENNLQNILVKKYEFIFLDNYKNKLNKIKNNNLKIFYILEANLIEIEKIKNIMQKNNKNIYFILNKYNKNSIDENILKNILENKSIFKLNYSNKYNLLINYFRIYNKNKFFKKQYKKIINFLEK